MNLSRSRCRWIDQGGTGLAIEPRGPGRILSDQGILDSHGILKLIWAWGYVAFSVRRPQGCGGELA